MEKFLESIDTLHQYLCDMIDATPSGRSEYGSFPKAMFTDEEFPRFIELLQELKNREKVGFRVDKTTVWVVIHVRKV